MDATQRQSFLDLEIYQQLASAISANPGYFQNSVVDGSAYSNGPIPSHYLLSQESMNRNLQHSRGSLDLDEVLKGSAGWDEAKSLMPQTGSLPAYISNALSTVGQANFPTMNSSKPVCRFWPQGRCTYGANCRFQHPAGMRGPQAPAQSNVSHCRYFPQGRCHYGDQCRFKHESPPGRGLLALSGSGTTSTSVGGARNSLTGAGPASLLHPALSDPLLSSSTLQQRLGLGGGSPMAGSSLLCNTLGSGLGSRGLDLLAATRGTSDLENAQRNGYLGFPSPGAGGDILLGNGIAVAADDGDYHFSGQQQMLKQVASLNGLNGGNGSLSY
eukprot:jgi/Botrbrau1/16150/Bobra.0281s0007.1